ncbi:MAG: molecular chaperone GrpE [Clostridia bacterium]|jgi:molecular chaperone GrpE|nr:molecular chaperone GrpE [Clostridia bacterium]MDN5321757.1 molecular chaperone GrpE [Clostridia bacterium]
MTEKKVDNQVENIAEETVDEKAIADDESVKKQDDSSGEIDQLNQQINELNQRLLRLAADFDNFRKRTNIEKEELAKYANTNLICQLLPVLDNFQRALDVKNPNEEVKKFLTGMEMIYKQLIQILSEAGLEPIKAVGESFNPEKHEAIMQVEDNSVEDNCILEELRCGYMYKDKVIRPSMVKVARNATEEKEGESS